MQAANMDYFFLHRSILREWQILLQHKNGIQDGNLFLALHSKVKGQVRLDKGDSFRLFSQAAWKECFCASRVNKHPGTYSHYSVPFYSRLVLSVRLQIS